MTYSDQTQFVLSRLESETRPAYRTLFNQGLGLGRYAMLLELECYLKMIDPRCGSWKCAKLRFRLVLYRLRWNRFINKLIDQTLWEVVL